MLQNMERGAEQDTQKSRCLQKVSLFSTPAHESRCGYRQNTLNSMTRCERAKLKKV